ncbi:hypothetical protein NVP1215B_082 [Vibrio phage 1.215.B._10N.222.54.F7]|nr:hypothetical protein NVP1215A_082 [Vibrio phage 1.215.A._10N.222.54.F7]AUR96105.1 hypothetical protein NVP1215B_082 [Vibrio phage 1.215.B._10N.222.54.F7]
MALKDFSTNYAVLLETKRADFKSSYAILETKVANFVSDYGVYALKSASFSSTYFVAPEAERVANFNSGYIVLDPFDLPTEIWSIVITVNGEEIPFNSVTGRISISVNTSGSGYTCAITSDAIPDTLTLEDYIQIFVNGYSYSFLFDRLTTSEDGLGAPTKTLNGVSPLLKHGSPRALAIDFTNNTPILASDLARNLIGYITWEIVDWMIPEYRLAVTQQTPLDIVRAVVEAAGGFLTSDRQGRPIAKYKYPISTKDYPTATPAKVFNTFDHVMSKRTNLDPKTGFNSFIVTDVAPGTLGTQYADVLDHDLVSRESVMITAYLSPVRAVTLTDTAPETLAIETVSNRTPLTQTEDLEIKDGEGVTRFPIDRISNIEYLSIALTGVAYSKGANTLTTANPNAYGLIRLTYTTIANQYRVSGVKSPKVQFLLKEG